MANKKTHKAGTTPPLGEVWALLEERGWLAERGAEFRARLREIARVRAFRRGEALYMVGEPSNGVFGTFVVDATLDTTNGIKSWSNAALATLDVLAAIGDEIAASAGAACHADTVTISHVLQAMRVPDDWARGTIRFSVGRTTTEEDIDAAVPAIVAAAQRLQEA